MINAINSAQPNLCSARMDTKNNKSLSQPSFTSYRGVAATVGTLVGGGAFVGGLCGMANEPEKVAYGLLTVVGVGILAYIIAALRHS